MGPVTGTFPIPSSVAKKRSSGHQLLKHISILFRVSDRADVSLCENELILSDEELICGPEPTTRTIIRQGILLHTSALTLPYSSKLNGYLYLQRVSPPLKNACDMFSEGNTAYRIGV
jgi:hypothetical protein